MNTPQQHRLFTRRADRMEVFRRDPPATKLRALHIIETFDTVRAVLRLLRAPAALALLIYSPELVALLKVSGSVLASL